MKALTMSNFLSTLFDTEDWTCFTDSPYGVQIFKWPKDTHIFFSINPIDAFQDLQPSKPWHAVNKPRRADCNVTRHRNFLIEMDNMNLDEQKEYVLSKLPVSAITYSGGKSLHFIISLKTPVSGQKYTELARRIHKLLPKSDPTQKNPSRLSRLPFRERPDGKYQELLFLGDRIEIATLEKLLPELPTIISIKDFSDPGTRQYIATEIFYAMQEPDTIIEEKNLGGRNHFFFWLGNRLKDLNYDKEKSLQCVETAYNNLQNKQDFDLHEALQAARI